MEYKIIEIDDKIILKDMEDFQPEHIFECGQAFRWRKEEDDSYTTIAFNRILNVRREGGDIVLSPTNREDFHRIWYNYFDLDRDYNEIKEELSKDEILKQATKFGHGIRILNQDPFEMIISFIISANNQIPRIKKAIECIAENYGEKIPTRGQYQGEDFYSFPSPEKLSQALAEDLREICRVGFRDKRIVESAKMVAAGDIDMEEIFHMTRDQGKETLMALPGVGPKVSDCILLFGFNKDQAFPVDVWVKRVMEHFYLKEDTNVKKIGYHGARLFGDLAGFAQQYLFYYARELGIGKK